MSDEELVSITILNYNGAKFVEGCIKSILKQTYKHFEIIFVDNASADGSVHIVKHLKEKYKIRDLSIIRNEYNLGYCAGNNIGAKASNGRYLVFLNYDTYVHKDWLKELVKTAREGEDIGIVGSKILYPDGKINAVGLSFDKFGSTKVIGLLEPDNGKYDYSNAFSHNGASFLIRRDALEKAGLLDEDLFLYYDEFDLAWRIRLLGYRVHIAPKSVCYHIESPTLGFLSPQKFYFAWRNRLRILIKNYSGKNVLKRVPLAICLTIMGSFYLSLITENTLYTFLMLKALFWNIKNMKATLVKRREIQSKRRINDEVIEKNLISYPKELIERKVFRSLLVRQ